MRNSRKYLKILSILCNLNIDESAGIVNGPIPIFHQFKMNGNIYPTTMTIGAGRPGIYKIFMDLEVVCQGAISPPKSKCTQKQRAKNWSIIPITSLIKNYNLFRNTVLESISNSKWTWFVCEQQSSLKIQFGRMNKNVILSFYYYQVQFLVKSILIAKMVWIKNRNLGQVLETKHISDFKQKLKVTKLKLGTLLATGDYI